MCLPKTISASKDNLRPQNNRQRVFQNRGKTIGKLVEGAGFEPTKAEPSDLQSDPFGHLGIPPHLPSRADREARRSQRKTSRLRH